MAFVPVMALVFDLLANGLVLLVLDGSSQRSVVSAIDWATDAKVALGAASIMLSLGLALTVAVRGARARKLSRALVQARRRKLPLK